MEIKQYLFIDADYDCPSEDLILEYLDIAEHQFVTASSNVEYKDVQLKVYPNPSYHSEFTIESNLPFDQVKLIDIHGKVIKNETFNQKQLYEYSNIPLNSGIYFVQLFYENKSLGVKKLVITH